MTKTRRLLAALFVAAVVTAPIVAEAGPAPLAVNTCSGFRVSTGVPPWKIHTASSVKGTGYAAGIPIDVEATLPNGNGLSFLGNITAQGKLPSFSFPGSAVNGPAGTVQLKVFKNNAAHPLLCSNTVQLVA